MRVPHKSFILGILLLLVLVCGTQLFLFRPKPVPPLPFDTNGFVCTRTSNPFFTRPPKPTVLQRFRFFLIDASQKLPGRLYKTTWSFPAQPKAGCLVQGLLNDCMNVTGTRYLMPPDVAAGIFQLGHANTLNGPQMVAAVEGALQGSEVQWWQQSTRTRREEHLVLLRFPAQKVVVVMPESAMADFLRTNGIHMPVPKSASK